MRAKHQGKKQNHDTKKKNYVENNCEKVENLLSKISKPAKPHFKNIKTCKATHANSSIAHPELVLILTTLPGFAGPRQR